MQVDTKHPTYKAMLRKWRMCRAIIGGSEECKSEKYREEILPKLSGHRGRQEDYDQYVEGAYLFPGAARYREGLLGFIFAADPTIEAPAKMAAFLENVTGSDSPVSFAEFAEEIVTPEVATSGRCGILTDYPTVEGIAPRDLTVAEVERRGILPVLTAYDAEDVINWQERMINGVNMVTLVVLRETATERVADDKFARHDVEQWRVLELVRPVDDVLTGGVNLDPLSDLELGGHGLVYHVEVYRRDEDNKNEFYRHDEVWPVRDGKLLPSIPFEIATSGEDVGMGRRPDDMKPPLLDLVEVNVAHFRNSAIYEHGLLFTGSPQPYITGYDPEIELEDTDLENMVEDDTVDDAPRRKYWQGTEAKWHLGASSILLIKNEDAKCGVLVVKAEDLSGLRQAMDSKVEEMVVIGGRILSRDKLAAEAARTEEIRREGEKGVMARIGASVDKALTRTLDHARLWIVAEGDVRFQLNTDYVTPMTHEAALAWSELVIRSHIAKADMWELLRRGRILPQDRTDEQIRSDLLADGVDVEPVVIEEG